MNDSGSMLTKWYLCRVLPMLSTCCSRRLEKLIIASFMYKEYFEEDNQEVNEQRAFGEIYL